MSDLTIESTAIPGLRLVSMPVHGDARGWFKENWQREKMIAQGLPDFRPVQNNISFNTKAGTTRGIHAEPWDKYISLGAGRIFGAWVDLREGPTYGTLVTAVITPEKAVFVPRGVANAFQTLEDNTVYSYLVTDHWSASAHANYTFINLADPDINVPWPIPLENAEISAKDTEHPLLKDIRPIPPSRLLIIGATGQLGRALVAQCAQRRIPFHAPTRAEFDLGKPETWCHKALRGYRAVINAAAFTAVDAAETVAGRKEAWLINATAVSALAARCNEDAVPLLHVSTDYVFDGQLAVGETYSPGDAVAPLSVYGQSKAAGECAVKVLPRHWLVRTSWVIGEGKNFIQTMQSLANAGADPTVVDDQYGRLTYSTDLADAILNLIASGAEYGTYHVTSDGPITTWYEVARQAFAEAGHDPKRVKPVTTVEYCEDKTGIAPRPRNGALGH